MFDGRTGADPYIFYKLDHAWRASRAWAISEDLGIYEAFRNGPQTIEQICQRTKLAARPVAALLAANACMGIFGQKDGRYFIYDELREFVLEGGSARWRAPIPKPGTDRSYDNLKQTLLTNRSVDDDLPDWIKSPQGAAGVTAHVPERHGWRIIWGRALAKAFDFTPYKLIVDLGGATGGLLIGLTSQYPRLKGIVFDLPYSKPTADLAITQSGATERVQFKAGSFFTDPLPTGLDAIVMSHIIHDWDDQHCMTILKRSFDALPSGSPVIVQEFLLNDEKNAPTLAVFQWFGMLRGTDGDQRTGKEIMALLKSVGFERTEVRPIDNEQSIVIGFKP